MPELPEVETIRRELEPLVRDKTIRGVRIERSDIIGFPAPDMFARAILGQRIAELGRRGKYLLVRLCAGTVVRQLLVVHLRLSGQLAVHAARTRPLRFERVRFLLSGGECLVFIEPRVLGRVYLVEEDHLPDVLGGLRHMGLEPIQPEFDAAYLRRKVGHRSARIKALLLDQRIAAGVGNIYSDEALFRAGINPNRPGDALRPREIERLAAALRDVLLEGIKHLGTSMRDSRYRRPNHLPGGFQKLLQVFGREGEPCRICGSEIVACTIANRTSRYCPRCQRR
ncbi:MAG TPA: bifunctional DNA-formamidopyrimidine glycosylase/DNA-(apurinic or apyrimidinic site) lyase [Verrucomicrobiota bacterium]|nr:bifunctional DNA-formamidopyrimidine glycosylase/DNA-(apurinic or apyrimidinic site) lyase [Verrucomicrobiota bacterium]HNU49666.1 bifunctional DNA-formamidopyrimidine glycosylase/DNA-(apurinic or apyrimidinic site) lyase [Verrucomicrobiota bacterium]